MRMKQIRKVSLTLSAIRFESNNKLSLHVESDPLGPSVPADSAGLFLAIADDSDESQVSRGENAGRTALANHHSVGAEIFAGSREGGKIRQNLARPDRQF